jgi:hypothetical protein
MLRASSKPRTFLHKAFRDLVHNKGVIQGDNIKFFILFYVPIAVAARSKARTVFARSNSEIVVSNPT